MDKPIPNYHNEFKQLTGIMKRIGINLIAMSDERVTGTWRYLQLMIYLQFFSFF